LQSGLKGDFLGKSHGTVGGGEELLTGKNTGCIRSESWAYFKGYERSVYLFQQSLWGTFGKGRPNKTFIVITTGGALSREGDDERKGGSQALHGKRGLTRGEGKKVQVRKEVKKKRTYQKKT